MWGMQNKVNAVIARKERKAGIVAAAGMVYTGTHG